MVEVVVDEPIALVRHRHAVARAGEGPLVGSQSLVVALARGVEEAGLEAALRLQAAELIVERAGIATPPRDEVDGAPEHADIVVHQRPVGGPILLEGRIAPEATAAVELGDERVRGCLPMELVEGLRRHPAAKLGLHAHGDVEDRPRRQDGLEPQGGVRDRPRGPPRRAASRRLLPQRREDELRTVVHARGDGVAQLRIAIRAGQRGGAVLL